MKHRKKENNPRAAADKIAQYIHTASQKTAVMKFGGHSVSVKPFKLFAALAVILVIIGLISFILSFGTDIKSVDAEFESGSPYKTKAAGENVVLYNNRGAKIITSKGKVSASVSEALSEPLAETEGDYLILADLAGNHFAACYKNGDEQYRLSIDKDIISAKVTPDGNCAVATDTDGYKGRITVYNKRGSEQYAWNSGGGYITDIDITDNGRYLAVAQLVVGDGKTDTKIQFIDTRRGDVVSTAERSGEAAAEVKFVGGDKLVVVTDSHIAAYNKNSKQLFDISLDGKSPSLYSLDSTDAIAVVTLDNRGNHVLEMYSYSGKQLGAYTATGEIRALSVCGRNAAIVEQKGIVRVTSGGKQKKVVNIAHDVKDICYFDNGRILSVGASQAETLRLN